MAELALAMGFAEILGGLSVRAGGALGYRMLATETGFSFMAALAVSVLLAGGVVGVFVLLRWPRKNRTNQGLEVVLTNIAEAPAQQSWQQTLETVSPCPAGSQTPKAEQGWNRLVAAVDQVRQELTLAQAESGMQKLRQGHDSFRMVGLLDTIPDGIILADSTGAIVLANCPCAGRIGRRTDDIIGTSVLDLFANDEARQCLGTLLRHQAENNEVVFEVTPETGPQEPGSESNTSVSGTATVLRVVGRYCESSMDSDIVLIIRDISQYVTSQASRDEFIAHVSHEFRSPLTNIRAYAETLLSDMVLDAAAQKEAFNVINEETGRLTRLVNEVLDLSQLESGSLALNKGQLVLDRLVRQCVSDINAMAGSKQITLQTNYHPKLPDLYADRDKIAVVINNILTNAIKYTAEGGTVFVETNCDDRFVYIKITDTGYGIAAEDVEKIFEKFHRVDREETASITGSGLGLATTKEIVMLHGGWIDVVSELNKGTEMTVKLPITERGPALGPTQAAQADEAP